MRVCLHWRQDGNVAAVQRDESKAHLCDLRVLLSKINESRVSHWKCQGWFRVNIWSVDRLIKKKFLNWPAVCKHQFYNSCLSLMCVHCFTSLTQFSPSNNLLSCLHVSTVDAVKWGVTNKASCVCFHPNKRLLASLTWKPCGLGAPLAFSRLWKNVWCVIRITRELCFSLRVVRVCDVVNQQKNCKESVSFLCKLTVISWNNLWKIHPFSGFENSATFRFLAVYKCVGNQHRLHHFAEAEESTEYCRRIILDSHHPPGRILEGGKLPTSTFPYVCNKKPKEKEKMLQNLHDVKHKKAFSTNWLTAALLSLLLSETHLL